MIRKRLLLAPLLFALSSCTLANRVEEAFIFDEQAYLERAQIAGLKAYFLCQANYGKYSKEEAIRRFKISRGFSAEFGNQLIDAAGSDVTFNGYSQETQEWSDSYNADRAADSLMKISDPGKNCQPSDEHIELLKDKKKAAEWAVKNLDPYIRYSK